MEKSPIMIELEELHKKKLWHQATLKLLEHVQDPNILKSEDLIKLYSDFIQPIENKMNPLTYMKILSYIITQYTEPKDAIKFLEETEPKVRADNEALILCKILQGELYLEKLKESSAALKIIDDVEKLLAQVDEISIVHNRFYALASQYYRIKGNHTEYYRTCLKYLGSADMETIPLTEQSQHAFLLCLAALISDQIYNLGEILQHPILDTLKGTPNEWLIDLIYVFNSGNIAKFKEMTPKWSSIPDIAIQKSKICKKITLLRLMDYVFTTPPQQRRYSFSDIAKETSVTLDEVELLVMRAFSLGLLTGSIDEVSKEVTITWIKPKIIDKSQIVCMIDQLDNWLHNVDQITNEVQSGIVTEDEF